MDPFSYLSVLISIILALGITRLLGGLDDMLQAGSRPRIYWVHILWIANLFLFLVMAWWIFYRWRVQQHWTFFLLILVLIFANDPVSGVLTAIPARRQRR